MVGSVTAMNLAQVINPVTGRIRSNAWSVADVELIPPPPIYTVVYHYTPAQLKVLEALKSSNSALSIIDLWEQLHMSRFTIYDCVCNIPDVVCTGVRGKRKYYWTLQRYSENRAPAAR